VIGNNLLKVEVEAIKCPIKKFMPVGRQTQRHFG
jgi:hypothetical protein